MTSTRRGWQLWVFGAVALASVGALLVMGPIAQPDDYHEFADQRGLFGIPHFWNVVSNFPFLLFGGLGLWRMRDDKTVGPGTLAALRTGHRVFFLGVLLTSFGSTYYHLEPSDQRLVWDRLPMTLAFMGFLSALLGEHLSVRLGQRLLWPLLVVGVLSVVYWRVSDLWGREDLRPYVLVQGLSMLLTPVLLLLFRSAFDTVRYLWLALAAYVAAKLLELADQPLFALFSFVSGHTLKHVAASLAPLFVLLGIERRRRRSSDLPDLAPTDSS